MDESLSQIDKRFSVVKRLKRRLRELIEHSKATTPTEIALCEQLVFLDHRLERMRIQSLEGEEINNAVMVQMTNQMLSIVKVLGIEKADDAGVSLGEYAKNGGGSS